MKRTDPAEFLGQKTQCDLGYAKSLYQKKVRKLLTSSGLRDINGQGYSNDITGYSLKILKASRVVPLLSRLLANVSGS